MSDEQRIYQVQVKRMSSLETSIRLCLVFAIITVWLGVTYVWFGGSWVTDIFGLWVGCLALYAASSKRTGDSVRMTQEEMRLWLDAGCPDSWGRRE